MKKVVKLTPKMLKSIIMQEMSGFGDMKDTEDAADDAEETDADELADSLEKKIDYRRALKIEESRLVKRLAHVRRLQKKA